MQKIKVLRILKSSMASKSTMLNHIPILLDQATKVRKIPNLVSDLDIVIGSLCEIAILLSSSPPYANCQLVQTHVIV